MTTTSRFYGQACRVSSSPPWCTITEIFARSSSFFIRTDELGFGENMSLHRTRKLSLGRMPKVLQHRVERVELVKVPVRANRWARPVVADAFRIVKPLLRRCRQAVPRGVLGEAVNIGWNVVDHPMYPSHFG